MNDWVHPLYNPEDRWNQRGYASISSVEADRAKVRVCFQNGDCVATAIEPLLPPQAVVTDRVRLGSTGHEVVVHTADGEVVISWMAIRLETDPAFADYWDAVTAHEERQTGDRLRELRTTRGMGDEELACQAGVPLDQLREIEAGRSRIVYSVLERLLAPLGYTFDDLWPREDAEPAGAELERVSV